MTEVLHTVRGLIGPAKPTVRNSQPLIGGDILFRWFPRGLKERFKDAPAGRGFLQGIISEGQKIQNSVHQYTPLEIDVEGLSVYLHRQDPLEGINVEHSVINLQHVGIYVNETVIEVATGWAAYGCSQGHLTWLHAAVRRGNCKRCWQDGEYWSASLLSRTSHMGSAECDDPPLGARRKRDHRGTRLQKVHK